MKYRYGFVSNSSASSFCIFGCSIKDYTEADDLLKKMKEEKLDAVLVCSQSGDYVVGVGTVEDEIDHYMEDGEDWHDYESPCPEEEEMEAMEQFALKNPMDVSLYAETFFNG